MPDMEEVLEASMAFAMVCSGTLLLSIAIDIILSL